MPNTIEEMIRQIRQKHNLDERSARQTVMAAISGGGARALEGYYQRRIDIDANDAADLMDFPVKIELTSANMTFANCRSDGADLRIWEDTGMEIACPFWIESWDYTAETATIWTAPMTDVRALYLEYGDAAKTTTTSDASAVFEFFNTFTAPTVTRHHAVGTDSQWSTGFHAASRRIYTFGNDGGGGDDGGPCTQWINVDTGEVGFGTTLTTPVHSAGVVWHPVLEKFLIYGGRLFSSGVRQTLIQWYDPADDTVGDLADEGVGNVLPQDLSAFTPVVVTTGDATGLVFIFGGFTGTYADMIVVSNPTTAAIDGVAANTCADTTANYSAALAGVSALYCTAGTHAGLILLAGGGNAASEIATIYTYDPLDRTTNPVAAGDPGDTLTEAKMDAAVASPDGGVTIYFFGGIQPSGPNTYLDTIEKYTPVDGVTAAVTPSMSQVDDDHNAHYDSVNGKIYIANWDHSDDGADPNNDRLKTVLVEFDPTTDTLLAEQDFPTIHADITDDSGDARGPISMGGAAGALALLDDSSISFAGGYIDFDSQITGQFVVEARVSVNKIDGAHTPIKLTDDSGGSEVANEIASIRMTSSKWNIFAGAGDVVIDTPVCPYQIVGLHVDVSAVQVSGSFNRGTKTAAQSYRNGIAAERVCFHNDIGDGAGTMTETGDLQYLLIDWILARKSVGVTQTEPTTTVGSEIDV